MRSYLLFFSQILCQLFVSMLCFTLFQNLSLPMFYSFYWSKNEKVLFQSVVIKTSASPLVCHFKFKLFHHIDSLLRAFGNLNPLRQICTAPGLDSDYLKIFEYVSTTLSVLLSLISLEDRSHFWPSELYLFRAYISSYRMSFSNWFHIKIT